jgi:hypothetical protein
MPTFFSFFFPSAWTGMNINAANDSIMIAVNLFIILILTVNCHSVKCFANIKQFLIFAKI